MFRESLLYMFALLKMNPAFLSKLLPPSSAAKPFTNDLCLLRVWPYNIREAEPRKLVPDLLVSGSNLSPAGRALPE